MEPLVKMELFQNLYYVFLGLAILGFILMVLLFFVFHVPELFALTTGRTRKRTLDQMRQHQEENDGRLRDSKDDKVSRFSGMGVTAPTNDGDSGAYTEQTAKTQETSAAAEEQTSLLSEEESTSLLSGPKLETTVLNRGMTKTFGGKGDIERMDEAGMTATLTEPLDGGCRPDMRFEIIRELIFVHSDEVISV